MFQQNSAHFDEQKKKLHKKLKKQGNNLNN